MFPCSEETKSENSELMMVVGYLALGWARISDYSNKAEQWHMWHTPADPRWLVGTVWRRAGSWHSLEVRCPIAAPACTREIALPWVMYEQQCKDKYKNIYSYIFSSRNRMMKLPCAKNEHNILKTQYNIHKQWPWKICDNHGFSWWPYMP